MAACGSDPAQTLESVPVRMSPKPSLPSPHNPANDNNDNDNNNNKHTTTTMAFNKSSVSLAVLMVVSLLISTLLVTPAHACNKREWNEYYCKCGNDWKEYSRKENEGCYQICYDNYRDVKAGESIMLFCCVVFWFVL